MKKILIINAILAIMIGSNLSYASPISSSQCAIIVGASNDKSIVEQMVKKYSSVALTPAIIKSNNGYFAGSIGVLNQADGKFLVSKLKAEGSLPKDAYCGNSERFVAIENIGLQKNGNISQAKKEDATEDFKKERAKESLIASANNLSKSQQSSSTSSTNDDRNVSAKPISIEKRIHTLMLERLHESAKKINATTPVVLNQDTTLLRVVAGPGLKWTEFIKLDFWPQEWDMNEVRSKLRQRLKPAALADACMRFDALNNINSGIIIFLNYKANDGSDLHQFSVDKSDCQNYMREEFDSSTAVTRSKMTAEQIKRDIKSSLSRTAVNVNSKAPYMLNEDLRLLRVVVGPGAEQTSFAQLVKISSTDPDFDVILKTSKIGIVSLGCSSKDIAKLLRYGLESHYITVTSDGKELPRVTLTWNDCIN